MLEPLTIFIIMKMFVMCASINGCWLNVIKCHITDISMHKQVQLT